MRKTELERLGLNKSESKVYLTLLEIGPSSAGLITDKSQVSPSKIYWILEKLLQKGLVSYVIRARTKIYSAASPHKLVEYLEEKKREIKECEELLNEMLPKLKKIQAQASDKQIAEIFMGFSAVKNAYHTMYDSAKRGDEHLVFLRSAKEEGKDYVVLFFNKLHKKSMEIGLRRKLISEDTPEARHLFKKGPYANRKGDTVKFSDICPEGISVLNDKIVFMHIAQKPILVLITSKQLANDLRSFFNKMWKLAKK